MLNFLPLFKKKKKKFDIRILFILIVFVVSLVSGMLWSMKPAVNAKDWLPSNLSFYYEWTNRETFDNGNFLLFSNKELDEQIIKLKELLGDNLTNIDEIIWFRTIDDENNHYLVKFSKNAKNLVSQLKKENTEYQYYQPNIYILLITKSDNFLEDKVEHFALNNFRKGTNLYWHLDNSPEFLQDLSNILSSLGLDKEVFANIEKKDSKLSFNLFNKNNNVDNINLKSFNNVVIPDNFDLGIGFNGDSSVNNKIVDNLLVPIYDKLPYYGLNKESIKNNLLDNNIILQYQDDWLMVRDNDWQDLVTSLSKTLEVEEVRKVLQDGTSYIELIAKEGQLKTDHTFQEQAYWQIDGLFGLELNSKYYLSNRQYLIEQTIKSNKKIVDIYSDCLGNNLNIQDFISLKTHNITTESLNSYLKTHNIQYLDIFSYNNQLIQGYQLCLE